MVCDCFGRKKKIFESFVAVKHGQIQMNFCVDCNDLAYKIRDDDNEQNRDSYEKHLKGWKKEQRSQWKHFWNGSKFFDRSRKNHK